MVELAGGIGSEFFHNIGQEVGPVVIVSTRPRMIELFPIPLADGQGKGLGLGEQMSPDWLSTLLSKQNGQHIKTILRGIFRQIGSGKSTTGCHDVGQANQLITYRSRIDLFGPADD